MHKIASLVAAAALVAGLAIANAQTSSSPQPDASARGSPAADERNPDRIIGGYKSSPSPNRPVGADTTGAASTPSTSTDPATPSARRNPDGSRGGTPENPHPR